MTLGEGNVGQNPIEHLETNRVGQRRTASSRVPPRSWVHIFKTPWTEEFERRKERRSKNAQRSLDIQDCGNFDHQMRLIAMLGSGWLKHIPASCRRKTL